MTTSLPGAWNAVVVGAGSVGTLLAARLHAVVPTWLVTRNESASVWGGGIELIENKAGLEHKEHIPSRALPWNAIQKFPEQSFILLTNKVFHLSEVLREVALRLSRNNTLLFCQNGLGILDEAAKLTESESLPLISSTPMARAVCWLGSRVDTPPRVRVAGIDHICVAGAMSEEIRFFVEILKRAQIPAEFSTDIKQTEWKKALWNLSVNGLCALADIQNGAVLENPFLKPLFEKLMNEAIQVARAEGVELTDEDRKRVILSTEKTKANFNSTLQDLRAGRLTEMPWLNGALIRAASRHRISVPTHEAVYGLVRLREQANIGTSP